MRKLFTFLLAAVCVSSACLTGYADTEVGAGPGAYTLIVIDYANDDTADAVVSAAPYTEQSAESADTAAIGESTAAAGPGTAATTGERESTVSVSTVGVNHFNDASVTIDLGFTVVSPAVSYGGFKVAEGSVQLSDGSWATLGYDKFLRAGYYRLLREERDSTGVDWYVVAAHASNLGDYYTADGSTVTELWLKKSDCTATSSITLNTTDQTRQNIVRTALSLLGSAYSYGASGPDAFDCSGFTTYVLSQNGVTGLPRTSTELCSAGTEVGIRGLLPGDIVGRPGHVGIYIGDGWFVHSSQSSTGVICESVDVYNTRTPFTNYRSVVD